MAPFHAGLAHASTERRGDQRARLECPARLHLTVGIRTGVLWDLSSTGARFHTDNPPPAGMTALLQWQSHEAFCKVVWATADMCGVTFDRPLSRALVEGSVEEAARRGPAASVSNIPLGRRRSQP